MEANYNIVLVLPYISMTLPRVYTCSPCWTPPPTSLPVPSLWVIPVHQPRAPCIMHRTWTGNSFHKHFFNTLEWNRNSHWAYHIVCWVLVHRTFFQLYITEQLYITCSESESYSVVSDSLRPHGLYSPWNSPGQNTGVGSLSLLQRIFPTQGLNSGLPNAGRFFTSWATRIYLFNYGVKCFYYCGS